MDPEFGVDGGDAVDAHRCAPWRYEPEKGTFESRRGSDGAGWVRAGHSSRSWLALAGRPVWERSAWRAWAYWSSV
jgi:hypothetical protein